VSTNSAVRLCPRRIAICSRISAVGSGLGWSRLACASAKAVLTISRDTGKFGLTPAQNCRRGSCVIYYLFVESVLWSSLPLFLLKTPPTHAHTHNVASAPFFYTRESFPFF